MSQQPAYNPQMVPSQKSYGEAPPPYPGTEPGSQYQQPYTTPYSAPPTSMGYGPHTTTTTVTMGAMPTAATVVVTGNCPRCRVGNLIEESNTGALVCIIIMVILFFPIGLFYLLCLPSAVDRRCPNCGYCTD